FGVFLGTLPIDESRCEAPHAARSAWQHSVVYLHQRRQVSRRQCPRPPRARARRLLTSWIELISISSDWPASARLAASSLPARSRTSEHIAATRALSTAPRGSSATRP